MLCGLRGAHGTHIMHPDGFYTRARAGLMASMRAELDLLPYHMLCICCDVMGLMRHHEHGDVATYDTQGTIPNDTQGIDNVVMMMASRTCTTGMRVRRLYAGSWS